MSNFLNKSHQYFLLDNCYLPVLKFGFGILQSLKAYLSEKITLLYHALSM